MSECCTILQKVFFSFLLWEFHYTTLILVWNINWCIHALSYKVVEIPILKSWLHEGQGGLRIGWSCIDIFSLNELIQGHIKEVNKLTYAFFHDVKYYLIQGSQCFIELSIWASGRVIKNNAWGRRPSGLFLVTRPETRTD